MFEISPEAGTLSKKAYKSPIPEVDQPADAPRRRLAKLDSPEMVRQHQRLLSLYQTELDRQYLNRLEMAQDEDFYDGIQWKEDDAQTLRDRGQVPLVYNVISATIDWVTGTEKRARTDFKVLPRRKDAAKAAERKSQLMKYLSDVNREPFHVSRAFEDAAKVGIGWMEDGIQSETEEEPLYSRYENWRNVLWDSACGEPDLTDARYLFRPKWIDLDIATAIFPKRRGLLERSADLGNDFAAADAFGDDAMDQKELWASSSLSSRRSDDITGYQRRRVRVIEGWIRIPVLAERMRDGTFKGELFDPFSPAHREEIDNGAFKEMAMTMRMHVALFTPAGMLWFSESPYRHNRFPLTPIWGHRRGSDGMPYGIVRRLKDVQVDINKRASKALHIMSTNKIVMDEDALPKDMTAEEFAEEAARPDAVLLKKRGSTVELNADREGVQYHMEMMSRSIAHIQSASGVTDENLGRRTNASSGVAITRRQEQGALTTAKYFDNLLFSQQVRGDKQLANIEQFMTEEKSFRITNQRGTAEYYNVNDGLPENDIIRSKADFIISEADWQATIRQASAEQLMETLSRFPPEVALTILDLVVDNLDLPNREEIVKRIRAVSGQRDPDAEEPTPEELQNAQAKAEQSQVQRALVQAELRTKEAAAAKLEAEIEAIRRRMAGDDVTTVQNAMMAAQTAIVAPEIAEVADHILAETGFEAQPVRAARAANLADEIGLGVGAPARPAPQPLQNPTPTVPPGAIGAPAQLPMQ